MLIQLLAVTVILASATAPVAIDIVLVCYASRGAQPRATRTEVVGADVIERCSLNNKQVVRVFFAID